MVLSIILRKLSQPPASRRHDHSSSGDTSRYLLDPHSLSVTYLRRAVTSMRALLPSGNVPAMRVRRLISRFSRALWRCWCGCAASAAWGEPRAGQRLGNSVAHALGGRREPHAVKRCGHRIGLPHAGIEGLLGADASSIAAAPALLDFGAFESALRWKCAVQRR